MSLVKVFTFIAMMTMLHCDAEQLPAPTNLSYRWINAFTVNISWAWTRPRSLDNCTINYQLDPGLRNTLKRTQLTHHTESDLAERSNSHTWKYGVATTLDEPCGGWSKSATVYTNIRSAKPRVKLVKDFECLIKKSGELLLMMCSWTPVQSWRNLTLLYKDCGSNLAATPCDRPFSNGCHLEVSEVRYICMQAESEAGWNVHKPTLVVPPPTLNVTEDGRDLRLAWMAPDFPQCSLYEFCYSQCNGAWECQNLTSGETRIPYHDECRYEFKSRKMNTESCPDFGSKWSEGVAHGSNKPPDAALMVATVVVPIALFACIILTCYCLRKHRDILCPETPDPSIIFKEVLNGNKEHKIARLYTPKPETIEPCKISLSSDSDTS